MTGRRDVVILLGLLGLLITLTILTVQSQSSEEQDLNRGSTYANGRGGVRALYLWLEALDYEVERLQPRTYTPGRAEGVLWLITPTEFVTEEDADALADWVEAGGILVAVGVGDFTVEDAFGLETDDNRLMDEFLYPTVPWLKAEGGDYSSWRRYILPEGGVPLLAGTDGSVSAFVAPYGEGQLWLFPMSQPFTNFSLRDEESSAFVESVLAQLPNDVPHSFDEYHHGFGSGFLFGEERGLLARMVREPWGWGLLYGVSMVAMWMILRGRRFGRSIPLPNEHLRREAGEYVQGLAWLYRRARLREPIQKHYAQRLKRRVTERYRLPLTQDDGAFLAALARVRPDVDIQGLGLHLRALQHGKVRNERQLQALAEAHQGWVKQLVG